MYYFDYANGGPTHPFIRNKINNVSHSLFSFPDLYRNEHAARKLSRTFDQARNAISKFINVDSSNITLIHNPSHGLEILLSALDLEAGARIILSDLDYELHRLYWKRLQSQVNVTYSVVHPERHQSIEEQYKTKLEKPACVVLINAVHSITGERVNIKSIREYAAVAGATLIVDGSQEIGTSKVDLSNTAADVYVTTGNKWLSSPFEYGFMYVNKTMQQLISSAHITKLTQNHDANETDSTKRSNRLLSQTYFTGWQQLLKSRGIPALLGAVALLGSLEVIDLTGIERIEKHIHRLQRRFRDHLLQFGLGDYTLGSRVKESQSAIVSFYLPGDSDRTPDLHRFLLERDVKVSLMCYDGKWIIRTSLHSTHTMEDIDVLAQFIEPFCKTPTSV